MDRLLRLGGAMPGLSQGPPPSDAPVVDTAEQVEFTQSLKLFNNFISIMIRYFIIMTSCFLNYLDKKL